MQPLILNEVKNTQHPVTKTKVSKFASGLLLFQLSRWYISWASSMTRFHVCLLIQILWEAQWPCEQRERLVYIFAVGVAIEDGSSVLKARNCKQVTSQWIFSLLAADYRYESRTCTLSCFASTNSWFVNRNHEKLKVRNSGIHLIYKILISSTYFTASQNDKANRWEFVLAKVLNTIQ